MNAHGINKCSFLSSCSGMNELVDKFNTAYDRHTRRGGRTAFMWELCLVAHFWWTSSEHFSNFVGLDFFFTSFCWLGTGYWSLVLLWFKRIGRKEKNGKSPYDCPLQLKWKKRYLLWHFSITSLRCRGDKRFVGQDMNFHCDSLLSHHPSFSCCQTKFFCTAFGGVKLLLGQEEYVVEELQSQHFESICSYFCLTIIIIFILVKCEVFVMGISWHWWANLNGFKNS